MTGKQLYANLFFFGQLIVQEEEQAVVET